MTVPSNEIKRPNFERQQHASSKEVKKPEAAEKVHKQTSEVLGKDEVEAGTEFSMGTVAEGAQEDKSKAGQGGGGQAKGDDDVEAIRAKLLARVPPQEVMVRQIKKKLYGEQHKLLRHVGDLSRRADKNAYLLTEIIKKLRVVREYFSVLAHATYEMVKHLWLKIVHGV